MSFTQNYSNLAILTIVLIVTIATIIHFILEHKSRIKKIHNERRSQREEYKNGTRDALEKLQNRLVDEVFSELSEFTNNKNKEENLDYIARIRKETEVSGKSVTIRIGWGKKRNNSEIIFEEVITIEFNLLAKPEIVVLYGSTSRPESKLELGAKKEDVQFVLENVTSRIKDFVPC
jgi:hypothetical protein